MRLARLRCMAWFGLAICMPLAAQEPGRIYRVAILSINQTSIDLMRQFTLPELAKAGFVEGRNLALVVRSADGAMARLPALAREIADARVDLAIVVSSAGVEAARQAMPNLPLVMSYGDEPVARGFAASLGRPGGSVTGISMQARESNLKRLEVMRQLLPAARRIGVLAPPHFPNAQRGELRQVAQRLGVELVFAGAAQRSDYDTAFASLRSGRAEGLITVSHPGYVGDATELSRRAIAQQLPLLCEWREMAVAGCLFAFGPTHRELRTRTAHFVVRILRGEAPGAIAIEQPARFELVINLLTAKALGLTIPPALLSRADEVIE
jgi:putative tryptophan/tyrosine transport system substrate-binding protein